MGRLPKPSWMLDVEVVVILMVHMCPLFKITWGVGFGTPPPYGKVIHV